MPNLNKVMLIGNITREPEMKYTPKGTAIAAFGLAVNRKYTTEAGEKREEVTFVDLEAYARLAEIIGEYCHKGSPIYIEGRLKLDAWDDKQSGQKRSKMKVICESMQLLGGKPQDGGQQQQRPQGQGQPAQQPRRAPQQAPARGNRAPAQQGYDPDLDAPPDDSDFQ